MVANLILALATLTIGDVHSSNCAAAPAQVQARTAPLHVQLQIVPAAPVTEKLVRTIVSTAAAIWAPTMSTSRRCLRRRVRRWTEESG